MKLSRKSDYALRALFTLVEHYGGPPVPTRVLAERNDIPKPFLEHILLEMKAQGWVNSVAGKNGGYYLARSPDQVTMGSVVRLFDEQLAPIACVSATHYEPCNQEAVCRFRRVLLDIRNQTASVMEKMTLARVFENAPVSRKEVFADRYWDGGGI